MAGFVGATIGAMVGIPAFSIWVSSILMQRIVPHGLAADIVSTLLVALVFALSMAHDKFELELTRWQKAVVLIAGTAAALALHINTP